jgi:hypothetical protein
MRGQFDWKLQILLIDHMIFDIGVYLREWVLKPDCVFSHEVNYELQKAYIGITKKYSYFFEIDSIKEICIFIYSYSIV